MSDVVLASAERSPRRGADGTPLVLRALTGTALIGSGAIVIWLALVTWGQADGLVKVPVVLAGLVLVFRGVDRIAQAVSGGRLDTGLCLCVVWLVGLVSASIFAGFLPLSEHQDSASTLAIPGNARPDLLTGHPLGTNNFSLDILARCVHGARVSILTVGLAVSIGLIIGGTIGMCAGYYRGRIEVGIGVLTDTILAFPPLLLLVAFAGVFGQPTEVTEAVTKNGLALAVVGIPTMIRLSRANTLVFAQREFVLASRSMGARDRRIIFRDLLPNVVLPMVSYTFIIVAVLIVAEGSLAFLGLGLQQPKPTWGNMIAEGNLQVLRDHPHVPLAPGVFMFLTVYSFNRVGEHARNRWDPRGVS